MPKASMLCARIRTFVHRLKLTESHELEQLRRRLEGDGLAFPWECGLAGALDGGIEQRDGLISIERELSRDLARPGEQFPLHWPPRPQEAAGAKAHSRLEGERGGAQSERGKHSTSSRVRSVVGLSVDREAE